FPSPNLLQYSKSSRSATCPPCGNRNPASSFTSMLSPCSAQARWICAESRPSQRHCQSRSKPPASLITAIDVSRSTPSPLLVAQSFDGIEIRGADGGNHAAHKPGYHENHCGDGDRAGGDDEADIGVRRILRDLAVERDAAHRYGDKPCQ